MNDDDIPRERDLPPGRFAQLKDELMAQIHDDVDTGSPVVPLTSRPRWRRVAVAAAALAVGFGVATAAMTRDGGSASANTAHLADDGTILITFREPTDPEALQQRLNDLGAPAVVDFLESGYECDRSRSDDWILEPHPEELFTFASTAHEPRPDDQWRLDPSFLRPGETIVIEFQFDEHEGEFAAGAGSRVSAGPVGPCVPVPGGPIVDADGAFAGG